MPRKPSPPAIEPLTERQLRHWPLPQPDGDGDKNDRGRVLVVAGTMETPGAALLAATAALRVGAGKLCVATVASCAPGLALLLPEARVIGLPTTASGGLGADSAAPLAALAGQFDAVLAGPGLIVNADTDAFVSALLPIFAPTPMILDAGAMPAVCARKRSKRQSTSPLLLTPHAGEMAQLCGIDKDSIIEGPESIASERAKAWNIHIALKGATTCIATPDGRLWRHEGGNIGLASSGSGDTLAGIIAGIAARSGDIEQAAVWGVALHARAGEQLAAKCGPLGYLAREIAGEIPALLRALGGH